MTAATVPGIDARPTDNDRLLTWVRAVADLTMPDRVVWCDGSDAEWERLTGQLVEAGDYSVRVPESIMACVQAASSPSSMPRKNTAMSSAAICSSGTWRAV